MPPEEETQVSFYFSSIADLDRGENWHKEKINNLSFYFSRQLEQNRCEDERLTGLIRVPRTRMEMNSRDKSALLLCGGTLMWTSEVSEDVGLRSPQNFVPESIPARIILPDNDGLRNKVVGFLML